MLWAVARVERAHLFAVAEKRAQVKNAMEVRFSPQESLRLKLAKEQGKRRINMSTPPGMGDPDRYPDVVEILEGCLG